MLNELDLREKPLNLDCLGDIKRMALAILRLRNELTSSEVVVSICMVEEIFLSWFSLQSKVISKFIFVIAVETDKRT